MLLIEYNVSLVVCMRMSSFQGLAITSSFIGSTFAQLPVIYDKKCKNNSILFKKAPKGVAKYYIVWYIVIKRQGLMSSHLEAVCSAFVVKGVLSNKTK